MRNWIVKIFLSKKMIAFLVGIFCNFLAAKGFDLPDDVRINLIFAISGLVAILIGGQAHADARTGGKTSASFKDYYTGGVTSAPLNGFQIGEGIMSGVDAVPTFKVRTK